MAIQEIMERAKKELTDITNLKISNVIGVSKRPDGWHVDIELIERKAVPDTLDLLGIYDVTITDEGEIVTYERKRVRRRMDTEV